jgi:dTMP kinase
MTGRFITFEGVDGAGKTTQRNLLAEHLVDLGYPVVTTREPGGTPLAEDIRNLMLTKPMSATTEALLAFAARQDHYKQVIQPSLQAGKWVLCDRYFDSTYAYQVVGRGFPKHHYEQLRDLSSVGTPDLTFVCVVDLAIAEARRNKRADKNRFDTESRNFFLLLQSAWEDVLQANTDRAVAIDCTAPIYEVHQSILDVLHRKGYLDDRYRKYSKC